jgi:hypothetical protein
MFDFSRMQFNRGTYNSQGSILSTTLQSYISDTDTISQMTAPGYFPAFFGSDATDELVTIGDVILIVDSTSFVLGRINSLSPVAIDTSSDDVFPGGIRANIYEGISPADQMFFGNNQTSTITIGGSSANVAFPGGIITNAISDTGTATLNIHVVYDGITVIGQDTASATTGIRTNKIDPIGTLHPLKIGSSTLNPVELGQVGTSVIVKGGIKWDLTPDSGQIANYEEYNAGISWSGPFAAPQPGAIRIQKFENIVHLVLNHINAVPSTIGGQTIISLGAVPVFARPISQVNAHALVQDNSVTVDGILTIGTNGDLSFTVGYAGTFFQALGNAGAFSFDFSYDKTL